MAFVSQYISTYTVVFIYMKIYERNSRGTLLLHQGSDVITLCKPMRLRYSVCIPTWDSNP